MNGLVPTPRFQRAYRRLVRKTPALQTPIAATLRRTAENHNDWGEAVNQGSTETEQYKRARFAGCLTLPGKKMQWKAKLSNI